MTTQQLKSSARAYGVILALLGAALTGALSVSFQVRETSAQEVFGVDMDFDDV